MERRTTPIPLIISLAFALAQGADAAAHLTVRDPVRRLGTGIVYGTIVAPDETAFLTYGSRGAFLWDLTTGALLRSFAVPDAASGIRSVLFTQDGQRLITGGADGVMRVWDVDGEAELLQVPVFMPEPGYHPTVWYVAVSRDGNRILTGAGRRLQSWDGGGEVALWDSITGERIRSIGPSRHESTTVAAAFSADGTRVITGFAPGRDGPPENRMIQVWNAATGELEGGFVESGPMSTLAVSADGSVVAATAWRDVYVWELAQGKLLHTLDATAQAGPEASGMQCKLSPDGRFLLSYESVDTSDVWMWDLHTGEHVRTFGPHGRSVFRAGFSADGSYVYTDGSWDTFRIWNAETAALISTFEYVNAGEALAVSNDGNLTFVGGSIFDWRTGEPKGLAGGRVDMAAFSPDAEHVAIAKRYDREFRILDSQSHQTVSSVGTSAYVTAIAFSPTGDIATGDDDNRIRFWNATSGELVKSLTGHHGDVRSLMFSPDGGLLLSAGGGDNEQVPPEIYLWDFQGGTVVRSLTGIVGRTVLNAAFSPDGSKVVTGSLWSLFDDQSGTIQLWEAGNGSLLRTIRPYANTTHSIWSVAFSPDGTKILSGGPDARLWDGASGQLLRVFDVGEEIYSVAYAPDGTHVLTGGVGSAAVWDLRDLLAKPRFVSSGNGPEIHWDLGTLQFAPTLNGSWTDLPAASPFRLSTIGDQGFFRVKVGE